MVCVKSFGFHEENKLNFLKQRVVEALLNQFYPLTKTNDTNKTKADFNHVKVKAFVIVERRYNKKRMAINEFFSKVLITMFFWVYLADM